MELSLGSIWRKWDLHIHTPASFHWNDGKRFSAMDEDEKEETLSKILYKIETSDIAAYGIMDYWTFDGYQEITKYNQKNRITNKTIFPGMELRIEASTDFRLNIHVLLSEELNNDELNAFKSGLEIRIGTTNKPLSNFTLVQFAKTLDDSKARVHGYKPLKELSEEELLELGCKTAVITRDSLKNAFEKLSKDKGIIILPFETSDGLSELNWKKYPSDANFFMQLTHIFETRNPQMIDLFLGKTTSDNEEFIHNFQKSMGRSQKPVVSGSDAHKISDYGIFPNGRGTWLKANCSFRGLLQVINQPNRSFVGEFPEQLVRIQQNRTKFIKSIEIRKIVGSNTKEIWFNDQLNLNPGLIAIIGNKGNGKSALTDIIALMGDSHRTDMNFLIKFKKARDKKADCFEAIIRWEDGSTQKKKLSEDVPEHKQELVKYIPQNFFEKVCNEIPDDVSKAFEKELTSVIFSHIAQYDRLGQDSLSELIDFRTNEINSNIEQLRTNLRIINDKIVSLEEDLSERNRSYLLSKIKEIEKDIASIENNQNIKITKPKSQDKNTKEIEKLKGRISDLDDQIKDANNNLKEASINKELIDKVIERLHGFRGVYNTLIESITEDLDAVDVDIDDVISIKLDENVLENKSKEIEEIKQILLAQLDWSDTSSITFLRNKYENELNILTSKLDADEKTYEQLLQKIEEDKARKIELIGDDETPNTLKYYQSKLSALESIVPIKLAVEERKRISISHEIYNGIKQLVSVYEELYQPVQNFIDNHKIVKDVYKLNFKVLIQQRSFVEKFLSQINQSIRSPYTGRIEGASYLQKVIDEYDFSDELSTFRFIDKMISDIKSWKKTRTTSEAIQAILKNDSSAQKVYEILFSLEYLDPFYVLKLGEKALPQLSPGERGVLLLIFYLLIDKDKCPLIIDQPEENLDSQSIYELLVDCVREAKNNRQIIIVTHNPNLAVVCDADQVIYTEIDKVNENSVHYRTGAIEELLINEKIVQVLEGTWPAFLARHAAYFLEG